MIGKKFKKPYFCLQFHIEKNKKRSQQCTSINNEEKKTISFRVSIYCLEKNLKKKSFPFICKCVTKHWWQRTQK